MSNILEILYFKYPNLDWCMNRLSLNPNTTNAMIEYDIERWNFLFLSMKPNLDFNLVRKYKKQWDHNLLSVNRNLTFDFVINNPYIKWNVSGVCAYVPVNKDILNNHDFKWDWSSLSKNISLTEDILETYYDKWDYYVLSSNKCITPAFIRRHLDRMWDWNKISNLFLAQNKPEIIQENLDLPWMLNKKDDCDCSSDYDNDHEETVKDYCLSQLKGLDLEKINKEELSENPNLTLNFILKNMKYIDIQSLSGNLFDYDNDTYRTKIYELLQKKNIKLANKSSS